MTTKPRPLRKYLTMTFAITYGCWGCLAVLIKAGLLTFSHPLAVILHLLGGFGPSIAAICVLDARPSIKAAAAFVFARRKGTVKHLLVWSVLEIVVFALSAHELKPAVPLYLIPLIYLQVTLIYGGNEELGWRGIMQPLLEKRFRFPIATLLTGIVWGLWHLPLWFIDGASQQSIPFIQFLLLGIALSFFLATLYRSTQSVLYCCLLHGLTNTLLSIFTIRINVLLTAALVLISIYFIYLRRSETQRKE